MITFECMEDKERNLPCFYLLLYLRETWFKIVSHEVLGLLLILLAFIENIHQDQTFIPFAFMFVCLIE